MNRTEDIIHQQSYTWFHNNFPQYRGLMFHVTNEGKRTNGSKLVGMGLISGIPDLVFILDGKAYGLECKSDTGSLSPTQIKIHAKWHEFNNPVFVFRSVEEFKAIIIMIITK